MDISNLYPSKWLRNSDLPSDRDYVVTIKTVKQEMIGQGVDAENKPIVFFNETEKGLVLNKTNARTIASIYGSNTDGWLGKRIALYVTEVQFKSEMVLSIRVRLRAPVASEPSQTWEPAHPIQTPPPPPVMAKIEISDGDKALWKAFVEENGITETDLVNLLGYSKLTPWLQANPGMKVLDATHKILAAKRPALEEI